jgi:hypothetical protein
VLQTNTEYSFSGLQVGLFAESHGDVKFTNFKIDVVKSRAFVAMQFNTPANEDLFTQVVKPVCTEIGLEAFKANDIFAPGLVIADIVQQIRESRVVIAEVSVANPNVYYEIGYADALAKPVILLAFKGTSLPFDVQAYRTIFYENTIGGKDHVTEELAKYLQTITQTVLSLP